MKINGVEVTNFSHGMAVTVEQRKGESLEAAIERTMIQLEGNTPDPDECTGKACENRDGINSLLRRKYSRPSDEAEFSPRCENVTEPRMLDFGEAIRMLKMGSRMARKGWNGKGIFIAVQFPDAHSKMTSPYIYIDTTGLRTDNPDAPRSRVPWLASQTDMLAEDWMVLD